MMRFGRMALPLIMLGSLALASCRQAAPPQLHADAPIWVSAGGEVAVPAEGADRPSGAMKALEYWNVQRSHPYRTMPEDGFARALEQARAMRSSFAGGEVDAGVAPWAPIGPTNVGGRTLALAIDPDDPDRLYAGSASGGLWLSTSGGVGAEAWDRIDLGFPALGVSTIALDPANSDVIYIGTGEAYAYQTSDGGEVDRATRGSYGIGILKSVDGGLSWSSSLDWSYAQSRGVWAIRVHPSSSNIIYAATTEGVYKSIDAGGSWDLVHSVIMAMDLKLHPLDPEILFSAHGNFGSTDHGIYRSTNGGLNWQKLTAGLPASWTGKAQLSLSATAPVFVYVSIADTFAGVGLYRSSDDGDNWFLVNSTNYPQYQGWYAHYVLVSPFDSSTMFTGGIEIWRSTNGGTTLNELTSWQSIFFGTSPPEGPIGASDYAHADHHAAMWHPTDPNTVFFASDGGVFKTTDLGISFQSLIGGYQTSQFYNGFANSATDPDVAIGGLQDNFSVVYDGGLAWRRVIGGDGTWCAIDPSDDSTMYGSAQYLQAFRSNNGGDNWSGIQPPNPAGEVTSFVAPYVLAPSEPDRLYAGRTVVYRSDSQGSNWSATNGALPLSADNPVVSLAVSDTDEDVVMAGTSALTDRSRIFITSNGGSSWRDISGTLPDRYPADIAFDPQDRTRAIVTLMGFGSSHVFETDDAGTNWNDIGQGLPDIPTSAVAIDPEYPEAIYVGTDLGIFVSLDAGANWQPFDDGISTAMVNDLKVFAPDRTLRAATHGSGAWERELLGPGNCSPPGEITDLVLTHGVSLGGMTTLHWSPPLDSGVASIRYDTISSSDPSDFSEVAGASCVESNDGDNTSSSSDVTPASGELLSFLVRARSLCGFGPVGTNSEQTPRAARDCPAS